MEESSKSVQKQNERFGKKATKQQPAKEDPITDPAGSAYDPRADYGDVGGGGEFGGTPGNPGDEGGFSAWQS